jgi:hypothetical protein
LDAFFSGRAFLLGSRSLEFGGASARKGIVVRGLALGSSGVRARLLLGEALGELFSLGRREVAGGSRGCVIR